MKCMKWFSPPFFAEDFAAWVVWFQYVSDQWAGFTSDKILRPFDHKMITKLGRCWRGQLPHCKTPAVIIALSAEGPTCEAGGFQWSSLSRLRGWSFIIYIYISIYIHYVLHANCLQILQFNGPCAKKEAMKPTTASRHDSGSSLKLTTSSPKLSGMELGSVEWSVSNMNGGETTVEILPGSSRFCIFWSHHLDKHPQNYRIDDHQWPYVLHGNGMNSRSSVDTVLRASRSEYVKDPF